MKHKELNQTENTKKFVYTVKNLKKTGVIKSYAEVIQALDWDKTTFSNVLNGRQNIPDWRFVKFAEVYAIEINNPTQISVESDIRREAMLTVLLSTNAEILAHLKGQSVLKINEELKEWVNRLSTQMLEKLK